MTPVPDTASRYVDNVTVTVGTGDTPELRNRDGHALDGAFDGTFPTGDEQPGGAFLAKLEADPTPPHVMALGPDLTLHRLAVPPPRIFADFDDPMAPATIHAGNILLLGSGGDGVFDNGNDIEVPLDDITYDPQRHRATAALVGRLAPDHYRLTLSDRLLNEAGAALDGEFPGMGGEEQPLLSGDGTDGGDCVVVFELLPFVVIESVTPPTGGVVPAPDPELRLDFSGPIAPETATGDAVRIYRVGADPLTPGPDDVLLTLSALTLEREGRTIRVTTEQSLGEGEYAWVVYGSSSPRSGPGQELHFTRNVSYFDLAPFQTLADDFTLEAWVRFDDWAEYGDHTFGTIYDIGKSARWVPGFYLSHEGGDLEFGYVIDQQNYDEVHVVDALAKGEWRHAAGVASGGRWKLYVGGRLAGEIDSPFRPVDYAQHFEVALTGYSRWAGAYDYVLGSFDEFRVWNVARSEEDIRADMHTPLSGQEPGLLIYHPLDSQDPQLLIDETGHGYHGRRNGTTRLASTAPLIEMAQQELRGAGGEYVDADGDGRPGGVFVSGFTVDATAPRITRLTPDLTLDLVSAELKSLDVRFDDRMDAETMTPDNILLLGSGGDGGFEEGNEVLIGVVEASYDVDARVASFVFDRSAPTDDYRLAIYDAIQNGAGFALDGEYPGSGGEQDPLPSGDGAPGGDFAVEFSLDPAPRVADVVPVPGSRRNHLEEVVLTFDEPVDPASTVRDAFRVIGDGADDLFGTGDDRPLLPENGEIQLLDGGRRAVFTLASQPSDDTYHVYCPSIDAIAAPFAEEPEASVWQLNGATSWIQATGQMEVVPYQGSLAGSFFWTRRTLIERFRIEFDFRIHDEGGNGDGLTCAFWDHTSPAILGASGGSLGLGGAPGRGFAVEVDVFDNGNMDPNGNHVALITQPTQAPLAATEVSLPLKTHEEFWHMRIECARGRVLVWLRNDGLGYQETLMIDHTIAGFAPYTGFMGFTASTGGSQNPIYIDNVVLTTDVEGSSAFRDLAGVPLDGEFGGSFPSGDGLPGGAFHAQVVIDRTPPVVSDTDPPQRSIDVDRDRAEVLVRFNEAMDTPSVEQPGAYRLLLNNVYVVSIGVPRYDPQTRRVTIPVNHGQRLPDGTYLLTVQGDLLHDEAGNALDGDADGEPGGTYVLQFTRDTVPPVVTDTYPPALSENDDPDLWLLEVTFDSAVDLNRVQNPAAYALTGSGGDDDFDSGNEYLLRVNFAAYDPRARTVFLLVNYGLGLPDDMFELVVRGIEPNAIRDLAGHFLDGDEDGEPGGHFVTYFWVNAGLRGDIDGDCDVDVEDFARLMAAFNGPNNPPGDPEADLDGDEDCDIDDFVLLVATLTGPGPGCP
jgi:hypothetical protein